MASNKRYLEFIGSSAHPRWLDMKDAKRFPTSKSNSGYMKYLFIRKVKDAEFIEWIRVKQLRLSYSEIVANSNRCQVYRLTESPGCLKFYLEKMSEKSQTGCERGSASSQLRKTHAVLSEHVIVTAVSSASYQSALTLQCTLKKYHMHNIVYWSLDVEVHEKLIRMDKLSIYLPELLETATYTTTSNTASTSLRWKSKILQKVLSGTGFGVTFIDSSLNINGDYLINVIRENQGHVYFMPDDITVSQEKERLNISHNDKAVREEKEEEEDLIEEEEIEESDEKEENTSLTGGEERTTDFNSGEIEMRDFAEDFEGLMLHQTVELEIEEATPTQDSSTASQPFTSLPPVSPDFIIISNKQDSVQWLRSINELLLADPNLNEAEAYLQVQSSKVQFSLLRRSNLIFTSKKVNANSFC